MLKSLLRLAAISFISVSFVAQSGVVVDSTRHLYKEGSREISTNIENKDDTPYL
ncbi:molecular chaperone, partial [Klebsiella oxytoca]